MSSCRNIFSTISDSVKKQQRYKWFHVISAFPSKYLRPVYLPHFTYLSPPTLYQPPSANFQPTKSWNLLKSSPNLKLAVRLDIAAPLMCNYALSLLYEISQSSENRPLAFWILKRHNRYKTRHIRPIHLVCALGRTWGVCREGRRRRGEGWRWLRQATRLFALLHGIQRGWPSSVCHGAF